LLVIVPNQLYAFYKKLILLLTEVTIFEPRHGC